MDSLTFYQELDMGPDLFQREQAVVPARRREYGVGQLGNRPRSLELSEDALQAVLMMGPDGCDAGAEVGHRRAMAAERRSGSVVPTLESVQRPEIGRQTGMPGKRPRGHMGRHIRQDVI